MTKNEALELIERMPYITTLMIKNDKARLEVFSAALQSSDPVDLVKLIKTDYIRKNDKAARKMPSEEEQKMATEAKSILYSQLSQSLDIAPHDVEDFIIQHLSEEW